MNVFVEMPPLGGRQEARCRNFDGNAGDGLLELIEARSGSTGDAVRQPCPGRLREWFLGVQASRGTP